MPCRSSMRFMTAWLLQRMIEQINILAKRQKK